MSRTATGKRSGPAKTEPSKGLWWDRRPYTAFGGDEEVERHRIVVIEYRDGIPHSVVTEEHWDHSRKPWFKEGRDKPRGTCAQSWDFEWSKNHEMLFCHNSGGGGDPLEYEVHRFVHPSPPPGQIWIAEDVRLHRWISEDRPKVFIRPDRLKAELLSRGYTLLARPLVVAGQDEYGSRKRSRNPLLVADERPEDFAYCKVCDDHFPRDENYECEHLEWCDDCACLVYADTHVREDDPDGEPVVHDDENDCDD